MNHRPVLVSDAAATPARVAPAAPSTPDDEYLHWREIGGLLRRQWPLIAGALAIAAVVAAIYTARTPRVYEASGSLLIEKQEYNLPTIVTNTSTDEGEISTEIEMLRSAHLHHDVARGLALNVSVRGSRAPRSSILAMVEVTDSTPAGRIAIDRAPGDRFVATDLRSGDHTDTLDLGTPVTVGGVHFTLHSAGMPPGRTILDVGTIDGAAQAMENDLKIGRGERNANVIWVRYRSTDSALARRVPALLLQEYLADRTTSATGKLHDAVAFLQHQSDTLRDQLAAADQALEAFRQRAGVVSLSDQATSAVTATTDLRMKQSTIDAERTALRQVMTQSDTSAAATRELAAFPTLIGNPIVANLLHTIGDLESQRTELLVRRTPRDPDVIALATQIKRADAQLHALTTTYLTGLDKQSAAYNHALAAQSAVASRIPGEDLQEDELTRQPKVLSDVYAMVQTRLQEARIAESDANPGVSVIDAPSTPTAPIWPRRGLILAIALILGGCLGTGAGWIREGLDGAIHSRADVSRAVSLPVLGVVPHIASGTLSPERMTASAVPVSRALPAIGNGWARRQQIRDASAVGAVLEAYTWLETSLAFTEPAGELRIIAFTSALAREGKTLTAANFAASVAQHGRRVLLVDADLRRGLVHETFDVPAEPGLADVLQRTTPAPRAIQTVVVGDGASLDVLPRGARPAHPTVCLGSTTFTALLRGLQNRYDLVVLDCPPVNLVSDALVIGGRTDGVVLVARAGVTDAESLTQASQHLRDAGVPILGVLLNDIHPQRDASYDRSYYYLEQAGAYATTADG